MYRFYRTKNLPSPNCTTKAVQGAKEADCVLEKPQMSSGNAQRPAFRWRRVLLPPEPQPYKATLSYFLGWINPVHTACSLRSQRSYWLSIMERMPLLGGALSPHPELAHKHPPCNKASMSLSVGTWGRQDTGVKSEIFRCPWEISHTSYPFLSIYSHLFGSKRTLNEWKVPSTPTCVLKFTGSLLLLCSGAFRRPAHSCASSELIRQ